MARKTNTTDRPKRRTPQDRDEQRARRRAKVARDRREQRHGHR